MNALRKYLCRKIPRNWAPEMFFLAALLVKRVFVAYVTKLYIYCSCVNSELLNLY